MKKVHFVWGPALLSILFMVPLNSIADDTCNYERYRTFPSGTSRIRGFKRCSLLRLEASDVTSSSWRLHIQIGPQNTFVPERHIELKRMKNTFKFMLDEKKGVGNVDDYNGIEFCRSHDSLCPSKSLASYKILDGIYKAITKVQSVQPTRMGTKNMTLWNLEYCSSTTSCQLIVLVCKDRKDGILLRCQSIRWSKQKGIETGEWKLVEEAFLKHTQRAFQTVKTKRSKEQEQYIRQAQPLFWSKSSPLFSSWKAIGVAGSIRKTSGIYHIQRLSRLPDGFSSLQCTVAKFRNNQGIPFEYRKFMHMDLGVWNQYNRTQFRQIGNFLMVLSRRKRREVRILIDPWLWSIPKSVKCK